MINTLFLQSDMKDPYTLYEQLLQQRPVYRDDGNNLWAVYSYNGCKTILGNAGAQVPPGNRENKAGLNKYASCITDRLARLSNGERHDAARQAAVGLFEHMQPIDLAGPMSGMLLSRMDWVDAVCRKLPVMAVAQCLGFKEKESLLIAGGIDNLVKIMRPVKTAQDEEDINSVSRNIYQIAEQQLARSSFYKDLCMAIERKQLIGESEASALVVSNLIGLFIQSYDAGRGLLSNALLQAVGNESLQRDHLTDMRYVEKIIVETLRFDPPVHHTRRLAGTDMFIDGTLLKKGDTILVVLAAANRDPRQFSQPGVFDTERSNNAGHLTLGGGSHRCPAHHFCVALATQCLLYLFSHYKNVRLIQKDLQYEPVTNVRLPKNILISLQ